MKDVQSRPTVHWSKARGVTQATRDQDGQPIIAVAGEAAHVSRRVKDFLRRLALQDLEKAVRVFAAGLEAYARRPLAAGSPA